jgi:DNA-binding beta-propeller fold protein YncE
VGVAASWDGQRLYVGTDGDDGVIVLDGTTLARLSNVDVGPDLESMAVNTTGTRVYFTHAGSLIESRNLDNFAPGRDVFAGVDVREGGLVVAPNNLNVFVAGSDHSIAAHALFDLRITAPSALRPGGRYTLQLDGTPNAPFLVLVSGKPGYLYFDKKTTHDPRFFDLSVFDGFDLLAIGFFDANGHAELEARVESGHTSSLQELVLQAAEIPKRGKQHVRISNPLAIRVLLP